MKNLLPILICLFLFACKEQKEAKTNETATVATTDTPEQWLTFEGSDKNAKHIVLISGDEEYRSEESMPQLAKILSQHHGFNCTVLFAQDPANPGIIDANYVKNIPGLEALDSADLMIISTRFRALPDDQMKQIDDYLMAGKPVIGLRTATHAFNFKDEDVSSYKHYGNSYKGDMEEWEGGFGRLVLGENWVSHHGHHKHQSTKGFVTDAGKTTGITNSIADGDVWASADVYEVRLPMSGDSQPIIYGKVMNRKGEFDENDIFYGMRPTDDEAAKTNNAGKDVSEPLMPVAWTRTYQIPGGKKGKAFTSTAFSAVDFTIEGTRRLVVNAVYWTLDLPVPTMTNVELVGSYNPTTYEFRKDEYWDQKQLKISDFK
ncbi:ThuA domain-containing protein [Arenibacter echinorum]|uniref:Type 1 glutamine amidotransferase n=1 Tax=Arenibacter echinorum TaxID=440515 RepID=A0A327RIJ0_9FLAO|nr:hypothetical protein [Arenibacter echinorum]RAJ16005.1 hypothetical protein LV92_00709 [Arenibacter echinorum]